MEAPLAAKRAPQQPPVARPLLPPDPPQWASRNRVEKTDKTFFRVQTPKNPRKKSEKTAKKPKWRPKPVDLDLPKQSTTRHPSPTFQTSTKTLPVQVGREKASSGSRSGRTRNTQKKYESPRKKSSERPPSPRAFCENSFACSPPGAPLCSTRGPEPRSRNRSGTQREDTETTRRQTETKAARQSQTPEVEHTKARRKSAEKAPHR